jgi:hypothetical protein
MVGDPRLTIDHDSWDYLIDQKINMLGGKIQYLFHKLTIISPKKNIGRRHFFNHKKPKNPPFPQFLVNQLILDMFRDGFSSSNSLI